MNKHLKPVFEILLPELERAQIEYWVYGGIGIAALVGDFIRENGDVDIFVKETDFENTRSILRRLCDQKYFRLKCTTIGNNRRKKLEVIFKKEVLSVVPVFTKADIIEFRFMNGSATYPRQILEQVERNISDYRFITPPDEYIKKLIIEYLTLRPEVKKRQNIRIDAKAILTPDEFQLLFFTKKHDGWQPLSERSEGSGWRL